MFTARTERMKSAKRDAKAMVDAFRAEKESVYQSSVQRNLGCIETEEASIQQQTDSEIQAINMQFQNNEAAVRSMLVKEVANVTCQLPRNRWEMCSNFKMLAVLLYHKNIILIPNPSLSLHRRRASIQS